MRRKGRWGKKECGRDFCPARSWIDTMKDDRRQVGWRMDLERRKIGCCFGFSLPLPPFTLVYQKMWGYCGAVNSRTR